MAPGALGRNFRTVLGMLAVDRTRSGSRLESCALDCWKSWTPSAGRVWQKKDTTKVECLLHGSMLSDECYFVVAVCCMLLACRKLDRLPNWKNIA